MIKIGLIREFESFENESDFDLAFDVYANLNQLIVDCS